MEATELKASTRKETGKGPARRSRMKGLIPAVFYGGGEEAIPLSVNAADLMKIMKKKKDNVFIKLIISGEKQLEKLSLMKELQIEPVSRSFYHADFYEVRMDKKLTIDIPIHFTGTAVGVTNGGELQHLKRELKVSSLPAALADFVEVDVTDLDIGHSLKVQDIKVPEGMTVLDPGDVGVAMVAVVKVSVPVAAAAAAAGEAAAAPAAAAAAPKAEAKPKAKG